MLFVMEEMMALEVIILCELINRVYFLIIVFICMELERVVLFGVLNEKRKMQMALLY